MQRRTPPTRFLRVACRVDFSSWRCSVFTAPRPFSTLFVALSTQQKTLRKDSSVPSSLCGRQFSTSAVEHKFATSNEQPQRRNEPIAEYHVAEHSIGCWWCGMTSKNLVSMPLKHQLLYKNNIFIISNTCGIIHVLALEPPYFFRTPESVLIFVQLYH